MLRLRRLLWVFVSALLTACGGGGDNSSGGGSTGSTTTPPVTTPAPNPIQVTGRVVDGETNAPIAGAAISFVVRPQPVSGSTGSTTSGGDGSFTFTGNPDTPTNATATVTARAAGYVTTVLSDAPISSTNAQLENILLVRESTTKGSISGTVRNARTNAGIAGATVYLAQGQRQPFDAAGNAAATMTTNGQGGYAFSELDAGTYTVSARADDFERGGRTAIPVQTSAVTAQDVILSPSSLGGEIRIVLTWGATPSDLDSHLTGPNADPSRFHIYYPPGSRGNLTATPFAALDLDDTSAFGPETITVTKLSSGNYRYSVQDFTNKGSASSTALGASGAKVELYVPGSSTAQLFHVPNQSGNLWTVFEMTGNIVTPTVTPVNQMGLAEDPATIIYAPPRELAAAPTDAEVIGRAVKDLIKP